MNILVRRSFRLTTSVVIGLALLITFVLIGIFSSRSDAASTAVDTFVRGGESVPYNLENHTATNASTWTKVGSSAYQLTGASASVQQTSVGALALYTNSTSVASDLEVGTLVNTGGVTGGEFSYISPIVRTNSSGTSGIWAEADLSAGTIGLRQPYGGYAYIGSGSVSGFTFPAGDYYIVVGVVGSNFSMYMKQISSGMWLNGTSKAFDSATRIAAITGTDTQLGTLIGVGGYVQTVSPVLEQVDIGSAGDLTAPAGSAPVETVPSQPRDLIVTPSNTQNALSWTVPSSDGNSAITGYKVYKSSDNTLISSPAGTSFLHTSLTNGQSYGYYVKAVNAIGESAASSTVFATPVNATTLSVTNSSFVKGLSPYVWTTGSGYITSAGGSNAYFKVGFTGTTFGVGVDVSSQVGASMNAIAYPVIKYRIDGGAYQTVQLTNSSTTVYLAAGLSAGSHTVEAYYQRNIYYDSWNTPVEQLKITSIAVDSGSTLSDFAIRPKKLLVYGDSIAEGQWIDATSSGNTGTSGQGAIIANSTRVYITQLAASMNAEFGNAAVAGQGWDGGGLTNVPNLPGAWSDYYSGHSRLTGGKITPTPDAVFINMGTNGGVGAASTVTNWLIALRAALDPSTMVYLNIPFNGTGRTNITSGYNTYMSGHAGDKTFLVDLGTLSGSYTTTDGLHPDGPGNDYVAGLLATAIGQYVVPTTPSSLTPTRGNGQVALTWGASTGTSAAPLQDYQVQYKASSSGTWLTFADGTSTTTAATVTSLTNGTSYDFRVAGVNSVGNSAYSSTTTLAPGTVPGVPTFNVTGGPANVTLQLTSPGANGGFTITDYVYQYKLSADSSWTTYSPSAPSNPMVIRGLTVGASYDFRVAGVNVVGTGSFTSLQSATPTGVPYTATYNGQPLADGLTLNDRPTFVGTANPGSTVSVTVHSDPVTCTTTADIYGDWSCTLPSSVPAGTHNIFVSVTPFGGGAATEYGPYVVTVVGQTITPNTGEQPVNIAAYIAAAIGGLILIATGILVARRTLQTRG